MPTTEKAVSRIAAWLQERIAFEALPENAILVPAELVKPHPLVKAAAAAMRAEAAGLQRNREKLENPPERKPGDGPRLHSAIFGIPDWREYAERGVIEIDVGVLPMRVSIASVERALRLWNALLTACKARGMSASVEGRRARISDGNEYVEMRLSEKVDQVKRMVMVGRFQAFERRPTGCLRIFLGETKIEDSPDCPLEQQLNDVLVRIHRAIASKHTGRVMAAERQQRDEAAAQAREQARAAAVEAARLRDEELQRLQAEQAAAAERERMLVAEASAWRDAMAVRAYAAHVASVAAAGDAVPSPSLKHWLAWADAVAERLDPTQGRLQPPEQLGNYS